MQFKKYNLVVAFFILLFAQQIKAQDSLYTSWKGFASKVSANTYQLHLKGVVQPSWHIYVYEKQVEGLEGFKILLKDTSIKKNGSLIFNGHFKLITDKVFENKKLQVIEDSIDILQTIHFESPPPATLKIGIVYNIANDETFIPEEQKITIHFDDGVEALSSNKILINTIDLKNPVSQCGGVGHTSGSLWQIFFWGILGGLVSLFTPCVFPMIPLTVSFFTKKSGDRRKAIFNASLYGLFILLIYVLLSVPFYFIEKGSPEILNNISTNAWLNVFFFCIFIFFAFSFFGYYEISLPDKFSTKVDSKAGIGNVMGIFFMALTLAIVSFSCTGPLLGTLVVSSLNQSGGAVQLTAAMAGFGLAFGLPFALFAMFPNLLARLPKSGGWLNTVKVVLGFLEVGLAFKFLSNADLVQHWVILKREIFIAIWIIISIAIVLYLLGKIKFPHDSPMNKLSKARVGVAILFAVFALYLIPGLTNTKWANLSLISGFPPPLYYSIYQKQTDCVLGLNCTKDYEEGLMLAKQQHKPILLDFTGYACVNCRRMEENVWSQPAVLQLMKEKFIVISLYVDDKKKLPSANQFTYKTKEGIEKEIITVGDKWATFETENFQNNAQPLYAIISPTEKLLNNPIGYTPNIIDYKNWLQCGFQSFEGLK